MRGQLTSKQNLTDIPEEVFYSYILQCLDINSVVHDSNGKKVPLFLNLQLVDKFFAVVVKEFFTKFLAQQYTHILRRNPLSSYFLRHKVSLALPVSLNRIIKVSGNNHSLFLTAAGKVHSCGLGYYGQLGHGDKDNRHEPTLITALAGETIIDIAAGGYHSLFLTADGKVYSCGEGRFGKLGHGDENALLVPTLIEALREQKVVNIAAGGSHSLFVNGTGAAFSCGLGDDGQLGHGDNNNKLIPTLITALVGTVINNIAAGWRHSLLSDVTGKVFSCGYGKDDQLGHDDKANRLEPTLITALAEKEIIGIVADARYTELLVATGEVVSFGCKDSFGRLVPEFRGCEMMSYQDHSDNMREFMFVYLLHRRARYLDDDIGIVSILLANSHLVGLSLPKILSREDVDDKDSAPNARGEEPKPKRCSIM